MGQIDKFWREIYWSRTLLGNARVRDETLGIIQVRDKILGNARIREKVLVFPM